MKRVLMALVLVTGCGAGGDQANQSAGSAAQTAGLTGLYEGGSPRPNQLCVIDRGAGNASFGLVVWGANMHSCSGAGSVGQAGNKLTLTMAGDQSCTIEANISGGNVTLPATVPEGCAYYCGAQAKLGGATFEKKGATAEDAMKAVDLVGEPLCSGGSTQTP
ncbi:MAG TPA: hypothetical protein VGD10_02675 [Allosphingosinicella sp.]|uniref:hypothetical protein n=1 Tax=Allosphingosinicella sp. TaxID=2823234 RepID=UPI002EDA44F4